MNKYQDPTDMQTALDCAIREYEGKNGGYTKNGTTYCNYMNNTEFTGYLKDMNPIHKAQYRCGGGGELYPGKYPPKMASFGSSSRFIYELSKDIPGFKFEEKLDTKVGGVANLDGMLHRGNNYIYVEAKRREIYGSSHEGLEVKSVYIPVYEKLKCKQFSYEPKDAKNDNEQEGIKKITFYVNGETVRFFDLKQLICHFLGITYDIAKHSVKDAKVTFLYLLYNPSEVEEMIDERYRQRVLKRYEDIKTFVNKNEKVFESIFRKVLLYQIETQKLEETNIEFKFKLVDQKNYIKELK